MVEVPGRSAHRLPREPTVSRGGNPAIFVERAISEHLEVLDVARAHSFGIVKAVNHANTFDRLLFHAIHFDGLWKVCRFQDGR